jgi:hypothetical protein
VVFKFATLFVSNVTDFLLMFNKIPPNTFIKEEEEEEEEEEF